MGTVRRAAHSPYFNCAREMAQDESISLEAVGLMAYLLSKPDDWEVELHDIERRGKFKRDVRRRLFAELEAAGYFERIRFRDEVKKTWDYNLIVHETPIPEDQRTGISKRKSNEKPQVVLPSTANPPAANPPTAQPSAAKAAIIENTEVQNRDLQERERQQLATQSTNPLSHPLGIALLTSAGFSEFQRESLSPMNYSKLQAAVTRLSKAGISDQHIIQARRDWWGKSNPNFDQLADLALQAAANVKSNPKPPTHRPYVVEDWQRNFPRE